MFWEVILKYAVAQQKNVWWTSTYLYGKWEMIMQLHLYKSVFKLIISLKYLWAICFSPHFRHLCCLNHLSHSTEIPFLVKEEKWAFENRNLLTYFRNRWFMPWKCLFLFIKGYYLLECSPSYSTLTFSELVLISQNVSEKIHYVFLVWKIRDLKIKYCGFGYISLTDGGGLFPYFR